MGNLRRKEFNIDINSKIYDFIISSPIPKDTSNMKYSSCAGSISSNCIYFRVYTITGYLIRQYLTYQVFHTSIWILSNYKQWHKVLQISICILTGHSWVSEGYTNHWISWNIFFIYTRMLVFCFYKLWYFARKMW